MIGIMLDTESNHSHDNPQNKCLEHTWPIQQRLKLQEDGKAKNQGGLEVPLQGCKRVRNCFLDSNFQFLITFRVQYKWNLALSRTLCLYEEISWWAKIV